MSLDALQALKELIDRQQAARREREWRNDDILRQLRALTEEQRKEREQRAEAEGRGR